MLTLADLRSEFRLTYDGGDAWGHVMHWWFTIADDLYFRGVPLPPDWEFRPSPMGRANDPDDYAAGMMQFISDHDALAFGKTLARYARKLEKAGRSY